MRIGTLELCRLADCFSGLCSVCFPSEEVDVHPDGLCGDAGRLGLGSVLFIFVAGLVVGSRRGVQLREVALQQVFVSKRAFAVFVWTDEVPPSEMGDVVVRREGLLL